MAQEATILNKNPKFCSVIQVDKDVSFVVDNEDLDFSVLVPTDKNIGMSRKTYSKKFPLTFNPCVSYAEDTISRDSSASKHRKQPFKKSPKCTLQNIKGILKKRPANSEFTNPSPVPRKMRKKDASSTKVQPSKVNGRVNNKVKCSKNFEKFVALSSDSDVKIFEVARSEQTPSKFKPDINKNCISIKKEKGNEKINDFSKRKSPAKSLSSGLPCFPVNDVPITEADTAPVIPSNSVISGFSAGESSHNLGNESSMKWLSANGTIEFPLQNGESCGAKGSETKYNDKYNLYLPEMKVPQQKKRNSTELKQLYENLNEISWTHEKSFQQMLLNSHADHRHSARITAKESDFQKNLRRLKSGSLKAPVISSNKQKTALAKKKSVKLVLQKAKYGKLKPSNKQKTALAKKKSAKLVLQKAKYGKLKPKLLVKHVQKKVPLNKVNKNIVSKPIKPNKLSKTSDKNNIKSKIGSQVKATTVKQKQSVSANSNKTSKTVNSILKKPGSSSQDVKKGFPAFLGKNALQKDNVCSKPLPKENLCSKSSSSGSLMKKLEELEVSKEFDFFRKYFHGDDSAFTALQEGSKLRVALKPLEHTNLWTSDFYETFKNHVLEQALRQTFEKKDQESIHAMFQELQESCFNPQSTLKTQKKKRPEDEVLRSSARQSEGAFRYKEIVVKKHENYVQFVLVPNSMKQNSLTIEAMKELKEAFLSAKKDPNCRAVLLNSSGSYFCTGIDLSLLVGANKKQVAEEMASTIKDLVLTLSTFTKPVIAAVNGTAVGLGVSLLTYCDVVLASDKATFCVPATRLGYLPEGAITLTLPQVVGSGVATEMLLYGRRLTAEQALRHGLVSEVLWPTQLMNEVVPRIQTIVSQPLQVMEATKTMVRCHLWDKLKAHIEREWRLLPTLWLEAQCQHNIKRTLQTGWLVD